MSVGRDGRARSGVSISGAATDKEQQDLAASAVGVIRVMRAFSPQQPGLSGSGARRALLNTFGSCIGPTFVARPSLVVASKAVPTVNILESCGFVDVAPLCGLFARGCSRGPSGGRRAHSSDRITPGCT